MHGAKPAAINLQPVRIRVSPTPLSPSAAVCADTRSLMLPHVVKVRCSHRGPSPAAGTALYSMLRQRLGVLGWEQHRSRKMMPGGGSGDSG